MTTPQIEFDRDHNLVARVLRVNWDPDEKELGRYYGTYPISLDKDGWGRIFDVLDSNDLPSCIYFYTVTDGYEIKEGEHPSDFNKDLVSAYFGIDVDYRPVVE